MSGEISDWLMDAFYGVWRCPQLWLAGRSGRRPGPAKGLARNPPILAGQDRTRTRSSRSGGRRVGGLDRPPRRRRVDGGSDVPRAAAGIGPIGRAAARGAARGLLARTDG